MSTQCTFNTLHAMHFRCYHNYMIEENDNYKVMFYFLSPNVQNAQKFSVMYLVIKRRHKTSISFIFTLLTIKLFLANKGNLLLK